MLARMLPERGTLPRPRALRHPKFPLVLLPCSYLSLRCKCNHFIGTHPPYAISDISSELLFFSWACIRSRFCCHRRFSSPIMPILETKCYSRYFGPVSSYAQTDGLTVPVTLRKSVIAGKGREVPATRFGTIGPDCNRNRRGPRPHHTTRPRHSALLPAPYRECIYAIPRIPRISTRIAPGRPTRNHHAR